MKISVHSKILLKLSKDLQGVFTSSDLRALLGEVHLQEAYRQIKQLEKAQYLKRFSKGVYTAENYNPWVLAQTIEPQSYISLTTAMSEHLLIGVNPSRLVESVGPSRTRVIKGDSITLRYFQTSKHLMFGYVKKDRLNLATPEKAILDTLYYHLRGRQFPFDIYSDINWKKINKDTFLSFLNFYKNPKFISFAKGVLNANSG